MNDQLPGPGIDRRDLPHPGTEAFLGRDTYALQREGDYDEVPQTHPHRWSTKRVVVTGGTGNLGTAVVAALCRHDAVREVVVAARRAPGASALPAKARFHRIDVATDDLSELMEGADIVVHLAWRFQPTHDPVVTWHVNAVGSSRTFDAAAAARVPTLVHASSVAAYSPGPGRTVDESWPTNGSPTSAYGREKAYVERVLDVIEARHSDMRVVRMRPAFVVQRASGSEHRRLLLGPLLPRLLGRRGRLPLLPLPAGLRFQAVHATDAADAFVSAALGDVQGAFNIAADPVLDATRLGDIVGARSVEVPRAIARSAIATAWHLRTVPADPGLLDVVLNLPLLDTARARDELGWRPRIAGDTALREALDGMAEGAGADTAPLAPGDSATQIEEVADGMALSG